MKHTEKKALLSLCLVFMMFADTVALAYAQTNGPIMGYLICDVCGSAEAQWEKLKAGTIDFMQSPLTAAMIGEAQGLPDIVTAPYTSLDMYQFDLNCRRWPTDDASFRRAIALLLNKPLILQALNGLGARMDTVIPPGPLKPYINTEVSYPNYPWEYNPALAQQMLTDAGYLPWNPAWPPLLFWVRLDDLRRVEASDMLRDELARMGVPVDYKLAPMSVCLHEVMVNFNFNIYLGNWGEDLSVTHDDVGGRGLSRDVDYVHDLYSSEFYKPMWYNYVGFMDQQFDYEADRLRYAVDIAMALDAAWKCQAIMVDKMPTIPLWSDVTKKAYRTGWLDTVNQEGVGKDNWWTFFDTYNPYSKKVSLDYGICGDIEGLNVVTSGFTTDHKVLGLVYDTLLRSDPYMMQLDQNWMTVGPPSANTWVDPEDGVTKLVLKFRLPPEGTIMWHPKQDGSLLDPPYLTVHDVKFTFDYFKEQEGWFYKNVMDIKYALTHAETGQPGAPAPTDPDEIWVYMDFLGGFWTLHWLGTVPIIPMEIWSQVPNAYAYDPIAAGTVVGCGPWRFVNHVVGQSIKLQAVTNYYKTAEWKHEVMEEAFHRCGDADNNGIVWLTDYAKVAKLFKASPYSPAPTYLPPPGCTYVMDAVGFLPQTRSWRIAQLFKDEDFDYDGRIYLKDLATVGKNWGRRAAC